MIETKALFESLKTAADTLLEVNKLPQYKELLVAMGQLRELEQELYEKDNKIRDLEGQRDFVAKDAERAVGAKIHDHALFVVGGYGPHCLYCWEKQRRLFHLLRGQNARIGVCPDCKNEIRWPVPIDGPIS